jgi:SAM-dependent methyltransferase
MFVCMIKAWIKKVIPEKQRIALRYSFYSATAPLYYGDSFRCNLCGKSYRKFLPYGILAIRDNACCPGCRSLERTRLLGFYLSNEWLPLQTPTRILHFAPEPQIERLLTADPDAAYLSVDWNPALAMQQEDIHHLSFQENTFDLILNSHVLSVLPDDRRALQEMFRVCKPGGTLLLQEWVVAGQEYTLELSGSATEAEREAFWGRSDLYRDYGSDLIERITLAGFEVKYLDYAKVLGESVALQYGLHDGQGIFVARKPLPR